MTLTRRQAQLLLVMTGDEPGAIKASDFTALEALEMTELLRKVAQQISPDSV